MGLSPNRRLVGMRQPALLPGLVLGLAFVLVALMGVSVAPAQQLGVPDSLILTIESDRLFSDSEFGRRIAREVEAERAVLAAENRQIASELTAEERDLTDRRPTMEPLAFRTLADAFDKKVQQIRRERDSKARALAQRSDAGQAEFLNAARPILESLMRESGAGVILERSSVFLSANATDITDLAISRIDAAIGDGRAETTTPDQ
jgi:Skp family chaperone for outer membrane proteins